MRGTSAKRFLLRKDVADKLQQQIAQGVPVQRAMKNFGLECSRPTIVKLMDAMLLRGNEKVEASLNPSWLEPDGDALQMQPDGWIYVGRFPLGEWKCSNT